MANWCNNRITIVSSEAGIKETLLRMISNLENSGYGIPIKGEPRNQTTWRLGDKLHDAIAYNKGNEPLCLYALRLEASETLCGEVDQGAPIVEQVAHDVWTIEMDFATKWGCGEIDLSKLGLLDDRENYVCQHLLLIEDMEDEGWGGDTRSHSPETGTRLVAITDTDRRYGRRSSALAAAYCRLFGGGEDLVTKGLFNTLIREGSVHELAEFVGNAKMASFANYQELPPLFKSRKFDLIRVVLEMRTNPLHPRAAKNHLGKCCEDGQEELALLIIDKTDWSQGGPKAAIADLKKRGREDLANKVIEVITAKEDGDTLKVLSSLPFIATVNGAEYEGSQAVAGSVSVGDPVKLVSEWSPQWPQRDKPGIIIEARTLDDQTIGSLDHLQHLGISDEKLACLLPYVTARIESIEQPAPARNKKPRPRVVVCVERSDRDSEGVFEEVRALLKKKPEKRPIISSYVPATS